MNSRYLAIKLRIRYHFLMDRYTIRPIARIRSDYNEKFGIPRQAGLVGELEQAVVIEPEFSNIDAVQRSAGFLPDMAHMGIQQQFS